MRHAKGLSIVNLLSFRPNTGWLRQAFSSALQTVFFFLKDTWKVMLLRYKSNSQGTCHAGPKEKLDVEKGRLWGGTSYVRISGC